MPEGKRTQRKLTPLHHDDKPCSFLANFVDRKKRFRTAGFCFDGEANAKYYCTAAKGRLAAVGQPYRKLSAPGATWVNASRRMFPRVDVPLDLRFSSRAIKAGTIVTREVMPASAMAPAGVGLAYAPPRRLRHRSVCLRVSQAGHTPCGGIVLKLVRGCRTRVAHEGCGTGFHTPWRGSGHSLTPGPLSADLFLA